jgi:zinc D-Ala-D-Ala dipeptidase
MSKLISRLLALCILAAPAISGFAQETHFPLVDLKMVDTSIAVELRYAGSNNIAGRPLYPANTPALVRPEVALRLVAAQKFVKRYGYRLKIWDAYRPKSVQEQLWAASHNNDFVADPSAGAGSLHEWGIAVDVTLADQFKRSVSMPTDFDNFTPAASWKFVGDDPSVRQHLYLLQVAMRDAGFYGMRSEWWHFTIANWKQLLPPEETKRAEEAIENQQKQKL